MRIQDFLTGLFVKDEDVTEGSPISASAYSKEQPEDYSKPRQGGPQVCRLTAFLPYKSYDPQTRLYFIEAQVPDSVEGLGFSIELMPQTGSSETMADYLQTLFQSGAPVGTGIQCTILGSPNIEQFLGAYAAQTVPEDIFVTGSEKYLQAKLLNKVMQQRSAYYRKGASKGLFKDSNYRMREYRCVLSVVVPVQKSLKGEWPKLDALLKSAGLEDFVTRVKTLRENMVSTLKAYYLFSHELDPGQLMRWTQEFLTMNRVLEHDVPEVQYDEGRDIRDQMIPHDMEITEWKSDIEFRDHRHEPIYMRAMSPRNYPKSFRLSQVKNLLGSDINTALAYPCPFAITMYARVLDYDTERNKTVMKGARATQGAESPMSKLLPELKERAQDYQIALTAFAEGKGLIRMGHQILLFARKDEMARAEQACRVIWRDAQFDLSVDTFMQKQSLLLSLPMTFGPLLQQDVRVAARDGTRTVINAANMLPIVAEPRGIGQPIVPMFGRLGQPMGIDLFANTSGNFNAAVAGASGSGKSVFINECVLRMLSSGNKVRIFDQGNSYKKLCETVGGQYIDVSPDAHLILNPFSLTTDIDDDISMIKPMIAQMISPSRPLDDYELSQVEINLRQLWLEFGQKTSITMLAERLKKACYQGGSKEAYNLDEVDAKTCDPRIRDLGVQLFPFTSEGAYGRYFEGDANVRFDKDLVVVELEALSAHPALQQVVLFCFMYLIQKETFGADFKSRTVKKLIVIDEAWSMLSGGAGSGASSFIEAGYRKARKANTSYLTGTQSIRDYEASAAAKAAFENSDWMFLLRQKAESIEALSHSGKLVMDAHTKQLITSVSTRQGSYSEVFYRCGDFPPAIGRLLLDPFSLLMASSKAEDVVAVSSYVDQGMTTEIAIEQVLRDRGQLQG